MHEAIERHREASKPKVIETPQPAPWPVPSDEPKPVEAMAEVVTTESPAVEAEIVIPEETPKPRKKRS